VNVGEDGMTALLGSARRRRFAVAAAMGTVAVAAPAGMAAAVVYDVGRARGRADLPAVPGYAVDATVPAAPGPPASGGVPLELVVLGDSTVAGVGAPTAEGCLPVQIAGRLADLAGRAVHVTGLGVASARTEDVLEVQVPRLPRRTIDVVVVVAGPNDVVFRTPPARVRRATSELLQRVRDATGAPVVLVGNPRFGPISNVSPPVRALADSLGVAVGRAQRRGVLDAGHGATFVDLAAAVLHRFNGLEGALASDGFHPSPVGYGVWAEAIAPHVAAALCLPTATPPAAEPVTRAARPGLRVSWPRTPLRGRRSPAPA
jgi:lysophospholipase L1-like esterase